MWFFKGLPEAFKRARERDPVTFWGSVTSAIVGTVALSLKIVQAFL